MGIITIIKIIGIVLGASSISALISGFIVKIKSNKKHQIEIDQHKEVEKSLRSQIVDMIENQAEVNKVEKQSKQIKKDLKNMSDDELNINYANSVQKLPKKRTRNG